MKCAVLECYWRENCKNLSMGLKMSVVLILCWFRELYFIVYCIVFYSEFYVIFLSSFKNYSQLAGAFRMPLWKRKLCAVQYGVSICDNIYFSRTASVCLKKKDECSKHVSLPLICTSQTPSHIPQSPVTTKNRISSSGVGAHVRRKMITPRCSRNAQQTTGTRPVSLTMEPVLMADMELVIP